MSALDQEWFRHRPRCRCGVPLDYATDSNVCAACSAELDDCRPDAWKFRARRRPKDQARKAKWRAARRAK